MQRRLRSHTARLTTLTARLQQQAPTARLAAAHRRLDRAGEALTRTGSHLLDARRRRLAFATTRLESLSPLAVLNRGYALVYSENGTLIHHAADIQAGQKIRARVAIGTFTATVLETETR